jgi:2-polyprenyl-3-methyl-5-hydroxy-6-metoxy-1,4-benzoquinol methylase
MNDHQFNEGLAYAESNYRATDGFSKLDKELIKKYFDLNGKDVLDFGCGTGHMSLWFNKECKARVDAVDIDSNHVNVAKAFFEKYKAVDLTISCRNVIEEPVDKQYDFIMLNDVIEHIKEEWIPNVLDILVNRNLKTGGVIFFSYPPWEGPYASHLQLITPVPWMQYMPQSYVMNFLKKKNIELIGKQDLLEEYLALNHMTNKKLTSFLKRYPLEKVFRYPHTKLNTLPGLKGVSFSFFPFKYLVSKELTAYRKIARG